MNVIDRSAQPEHRSKIATPIIIFIGAPFLTTTQVTVRAF